MKTHIVSLGCPKNLVDTEASMSLLQKAGCRFTDDPGDAELLIVSACSFLDIAWQETIEEVRRLGEYKARDRSKKLVLMGCLPKHHDEALAESLPFVDHFLPSGSQSRLPGLVETWRGAEVVSTPIDQFAGFEDRMLLTPAHTAYVKIAEGCNRRCTFCAIPKIRGRMVSRSVASIVREIENLVERGVKEVSLLAQDITSYNSNGARFPDLLDTIAATGIDWIRIFYVHPGSLTLDLARRLFRHPAVCRYLETPVQHASDSVLKRMRRPYTRQRLTSLFKGIQSEFPDVRIRSEVIVGFPGESDDDFDQLKTFVEEIGFSSLGVFSYSPESNTPAASMDGVVPQGVMRERAEEMADIQASVSLDLHSAELGKQHRILVDRKIAEDRAGDEGLSYAGRYYGQAYDVDGEVLLCGDNLTVGGFVDARIMDSDHFDLTAEVIASG